VARALDSVRNLALMECASTGDTARQNLRALGHATSEAGNILIINVLNTVGAELANLFAGFAISSVVTIHCHKYHLEIFFYWRQVFTNLLILGIKTEARCR
jgi:hypothetical protein